MIAGTTRLYAVLGHPVAHSLSPAMHNANFASLGMDAVYAAFDVTPEDLPAVMPAMRRMGFGGVNLTIPLKGAALTLCDRLAPSATALGGVNTVVFGSAGIEGHNTDGIGFLRSLATEARLDVAGRSVLVLGAGGAGRGLALACAGAGAARIVLANRTASRCEEVASAIAGLAPSTTVERLPADARGWAAAAVTCELIIHATSQGMHPGESPVLPPAAFHRGQVLYDAVYTAPLTPIMQAAAAAGATVLNGLGMLLHQGAESFRIWTGREPDLQAMATAIGMTK